MRRQGEGSPTSPARMSVVNIQSLHHPATEADKPTTPDLRPRRRVPPEATRGHRGKAAMLLQSTERIISYKVKKFGIDSGRYRK